MRFEVAWTLALSLGVVSSITAFVAGKRARVEARRRFLFGLAASLALITAFPVAFTGLFFFIFGVTQYCDDPGGGCAPAWWTLVGLALFVVLGGLVGLLVKSVRELRRSS